MKIYEEWLREVGFKWEQLDRQPTKHWILWLGDAIVGGSPMGHDALGIELAHCGLDGEYYWHCWLRADYGSRYSRFLHVRHMHHGEEVTELITALTGRPWCAGDVMYGSLRSPEDAARLREEAERLDMRIARQRDGIISIDKKEDLAKYGRALP